jgi:hypothetical protein
MAAAQTAAPFDPIFGRGTPNFLPMFSEPHRITSSDIFQSTTGFIGIGTTAPTVSLDIFSSNPVGPTGYGPITLWSENSADNAQGAIYAVASSAVGGIAINGEAYYGTGIGVIGQGNGYGVIGTTSNATDFAVGVNGNALATTGPSLGVWGQSNSPDGTGGFFQSNSLTAGNGLVGVSYATSGFSAAVKGIAVGQTGSGAAVFGQASSPAGIAGLFNSIGGGNILVGGIGQTNVSVFRVDGTGRVFADGGFQPNGADFAESMAVTGDRKQYAVGDLLVIDSTSKRHLAMAQQPYSTLVAGIYSTKPGLLGSTHAVNEPAATNEIPLAVVGIVPCKVTAENGAIQAGDLLVASSTSGHAMKGTDRSRMLGAVVGKALEPLSEGSGVILVLVTLQ